MTAATMITGTVFSLDLLVVKTCLEDLVRINSKVELAGGFLRLLVAEICLVDLLLGVFGVSPNVVALIIEIAIVFNFASYVLVLECVALISYSLISIVNASYPLKDMFPIVKVCCLLICMNLPSSHHYVANIATASMTAATLCRQNIGLEGHENQRIMIGNRLYKVKGPMRLSLVLGQIINEVTILIERKATNLSPASGTLDLFEV